VNIQEFIDEVEAQPTYRADGKRWPHKRLALLVGIGQARRGDRLVRYEEIEGPLSDLLVRFGPKTSPNPQDPVWRLRHRRGQRTRIWEVTNADLVHSDRSGNPRIAELRAHASAGLSAEAADLFSSRPEAAYAVARWIAESIVPDTLEDELVEAVLGGLHPEPATPLPITASIELELVDRAVATSRRAIRNPTFAPKVLHAYGHACAVCSIAPKLDGRRFGLEAAHIRWANHRGPDAIQNGLCLCRMHHIAFDRGAMTIDREMRVRIAGGLEKTRASEEAFHRFDKCELRLPRESHDAPSLVMLAWHHDEVFRDELA